MQGDGGTGKGAVPELRRQLEKALERAGALTDAMRDHDATSPGADRALKELSITLEQLRVAGEELSWQNRELGLARQRVEAERSRYVDLFDSAPDGYLVTDGEGVIVDANRAAAALLGVEPGSLPGEPLSAFVEPTALPEFTSALDEASRGARRDDWRLPLRIRRKETFHAGVTLAPGRSGDVGGAPNGDRQYLWTLRDISARVRDEQRVREVNAELEQRVVERTRELTEANVMLERALARAEELSAQLQHALSSRIVIEQAKGRLIERDGVDADAAFHALRAYARGTNRKLHDVAQEVVAGRLHVPGDSRRAAG